jgi:hypothetical protein
MTDIALMLGAVLGQLATPIQHAIGMGVTGLACGLRAAIGRPG